jgi:hypothetical protein
MMRGPGIFREARDEGELGDGRVDGCLGASTKIGCDGLSCFCKVGNQCSSRSMR